jgi:hypothetical protein
MVTSMNAPSASGCGFHGAVSGVRQCCVLPSWRPLREVS